MLEKVTTTINQDLCTGCGLCVQLCPMRTLAMMDGKAAVIGDLSLNCGHCAAICPEGAITVAAIDEDMSKFASFQADQNWLPYGDFDTAQLVRLMASRRSCRNFKDKPVDESTLQDLARIGCTAPSATNSQLWTFTILPTREAVLTLAKGVRDFYLKLNSMAEKRVLRLALRLIGKRELDDYYKGYYEFVKEGLAEFDRSGIDRLFHSAPAAIVVGCKRGASLPKEDVLLACQNILLAAHSMGLGSCLIGMAVEAMKNDRKIQQLIGIPPEETIYSVVALGYSKEKYKRQAGRKAAVVRRFES
ncbi:MAG: nitroreductase family protein [Desulfomonile tiedjei]|uniref:Nitroreductase family protein n=1 Tax=Desulfomonile tiedjei TaxID=2358 RepID=A0A9D6V3L9_9BACT|nr:nitroreductase family protein [Desulfomonile tiedjei]